MLITRKNPIPMSWIFVAIMPWAAILFQNQVMGIAFTFSLNKFIENPASLTFILSLPGFLALVLTPLANLLSDRIWTRFGRRKPFVIASGIGMYTGLIAMAFAPNFTVLIAAYVFYAVAADFSGPIEPLKLEIIPPPQRGRATAISQWFSNFIVLLFYTIVLGRFDEIHSIAGIPLSGESVAYASAFVLGASMLMLVMLGIKEMDPKSPLRGQRITPRNILGGLVDKEFRMVYLLIFAAAVLHAGLGPLGALLVTEQFGITKQQMGYNTAIGAILNLLVLIPVLGYFADRLNRVRAYKVLITITALIEVAYYLYVEFVLVDHRPVWQEMVVFGEMLSVTGILTSMVFTPMVYDYIRRDKMGTYAAGGSILGRILGVITLNIMGLFVWGYSTYFRPPSGEMTRVVLAEERSLTEVRANIAAAWPAGSQLPVAEIWRATGADLPTGRGVELRLRNKDSEKLAKEREPLVKERQGIAKVTKRTPAEETRLAELNRLIAEKDQELERRATAFRDEVARRLGDRLLQDGNQVRTAAVSQATLLTQPLMRRPVQVMLEKSLEQVRHQHPEVIDLRIVNVASGYAVILGVATPPTNSAALHAVEADLRAALNATGPGLAATNAATVAPATAVRLDLTLLEEPLDEFVSPLCRWIINPIKGWFDIAPTPVQRMNALGRSLRLKRATEHVRIDPAPHKENAVQITALLHPRAPATNQNDAVTARLGTLVPPAAVGPVRAFYNRIVSTGEPLRYTVARPILTAQYAPLKYDYMCGYLLMFVGSVIGLSLTFWFCRLEARGLIQKYGANEAAAEKKLHDQTVADSVASGATSQSYGTYTPGYFWPKLGVMLVGCGLLVYAGHELWTPARLLLTGRRTQAEAVRVIKSRGAETLSFTDDTLARAAEEKRDRTWRFFTEFQFLTENHHEQKVLLPFAQRLKPLFSLLDEDGLPSPAMVWYDPARPQTVVFPATFATWFVPLMITLFGLFNTYIGAMMAWHANRPIELPPPPAAPPKV
jgi:Na+/melibiose symporter-like transporter